MQKTFQKEKSYILFFVVFLLLCAICIFIYSKNQKVEYMNQSISTNFDNPKTITLSSDLPISDELGKKLSGKGTEEGIQGYTMFNITNNTNTDVNYQVCLSKKEVDQEIMGNYIKLYLTDEADNPMKEFKQKAVPTYSDLLPLDDSSGLVLLHEGTLLKNEKRTLVLRAWLSDSYAVSSEKYNFNFDVVVKTK